MFYFFQRGSELLQCEVREAVDGTGFEIVIHEGTRERLEHHPTTDQVHRRWIELQQEFVTAGWWGPVTQDGRG